MAKEPRPKGYPKLKNYKPSQFMLPTSHYDKKKADKVALTTASARTANKESSKYGITRGASYYEGGDRS